MPELSMKELRAQGEPLGLKFPPGTSKAQAASLIADAQKAQSPGGPADPPGPKPDPTVQVSTQDAAAKAEASPSPSAPGADSAEIVKVNDRGDWWCPLCDHSQTEHIDECHGCHATRDGDRVKR